MQNIKLRKAEERDVEVLSEILKKSNYSFENNSINSFSLQEIIEFTKKNLSTFTLYLINSEIKGFSIAYSGNKPMNRDIFFIKENSIFSKIKKLFDKKEEIKIENECFYIDFIYFSSDMIANNQIFIKYLEMEKLRNNCTKILVNEK